MSGDMKTVLVAGARDRRSPEEVKEFLRRIVRILSPEFVPRPVVHMSPRPAWSPPERSPMDWRDGIPLSQLLERGIEGDLKKIWLYFESAGPEPLLGAASMHLAPSNEENRDRHAPPWLDHGWQVLFGWELPFWPGSRFGRPEYKSSYASFLRRVRDEIQPLWLMDGENVMTWTDERVARFVYYRDPRNFARAFSENHGLEGDPDLIVRTLREMAAEDVVTREVYRRHPRVWELEAQGRPSRPYKRLRFTGDGAVITEAGRWGLGESGEEYWETNCDVQWIVMEELVRRGAATKVGSARRAHLEFVRANGADRIVERW